MDESVKQFLQAVGILVSQLLIALSVFLVAKLNSRKDAKKVEIDTENQRNQSEATFRSLYSAQQVKTDKLERQVKFLLRNKKARDEKVEALTERVKELEEQVETLKHERDEALALIKEKGLI